MNSLQQTNQTAQIQPKERFTLTPTSITEAMQFADMLAKSELVPKDFRDKPANVIVAMQWGLELGLQPLQALQNIAVINGRPSLWGDAVLALVMSCPDFEDISETATETEATCTVKRKGRAAITRSFSMEDAKRAGLTGKPGPWQQYPKRMMQMRARGFAVRDLFADVLRGMYIAEEVMDMPKEIDISEAGETVSKEPATNADKAAAALEGRKGKGKKAQEPQPQPQQPEPPLLEVVMGEIGAANCPADMSRAAEMAARLEDIDERETARVAFAEKLEKLKASSKASKAA